MFKVSVLSIIGLLVSSTAFGAGNGELWEITSKMGPIAGMPAGYSMPTQVRKSCVAPGKVHESPVNDQKNCKISDMKSSSIRTSYRVECTGKNAVNGTMEIDHPSPNAYRGSMKMNSKGMSVAMEFSGKKVGQCTTPESLPK